MRLRNLSLVALLGLAVGACVHAPATSRGPAADAGAGDAVGLLTGDDPRFGTAMIGASSRALAGGAVGYYMDRQEARLREDLRGTGVEVVRRGDNITLDMPGAVSFASDSPELQGPFQPVLDKVAAALVEYGKTVIEVAGHTDSVGADAYNQQLSERRANSVAAYLASRGVQQSRMVTLGAGESYPVASNDTEAGRAANRRVELTIVPVTQESVKKARGR